MAVVFADSFDHYSLAQLGRKWSASSGSPDIGAYGRNGTNGLRIGPSGGAASITYNLPANLSTIIVGGAYKFTVSSVASAFLYLSDAGSIQVYFQFNTDASISVFNGNGTLLGTSSPGVLPSYTSQHNHIEAKVLFHNSAGTVEVRVNGNTTPVLNLTGKDTTNTANNFITQIVFINQSPSASQSVYVDDFFILDTTGSPNDFIGDVRIECKFPDGAGTTANLTPSAGSNFQNVDDNPANDDTDYNSSSTATQKDTFNYAALASTLGAVIAVVVNTVDRKDDAGARTHNHIARLSGTEVDGAAFSPTTSYTNHQTVYATKPGGGAWTIADVNNAEFGYKLTT